MSDALEEHDGKVSIGGRNITNLWFANDIDALTEEEQCGEDQTDDKQCQWHPERDKGKRTEVGHCNKLQVPSNSCFR